MSETKINDLRINKGLTKQQLIDSTTITENEISFVKDDTVIDVPTPDASGKVLTSTSDGVEWAKVNGVSQISVSGTTTVSGYSVPNPTAEEMVAIYNAVVAGNSVQVIDNTNVYYQVMLADSMDGAINVEIMFFSEMTLLYSLEHDVVTIEAKKIGGEETKTATLTENTQLASNTVYSAGELSSVTLTLPAVDTRFISEIHFTSGAAATTFAFPSGNRFDGEDCDNGVFVPVANKRYSIMFFYDGTKVCGIVYGY